MYKHLSPNKKTMAGLAQISSHCIEYLHPILKCLGWSPSFTSDSSFLLTHRHSLEKPRSHTGERRLSSKPLSSRLSFSCCAYLQNQSCRWALHPLKINKWILKFCFRKGKENYHIMRLQEYYITCLWEAGRAFFYLKMEDPENLASYPFCNMLEYLST